MEERNENLAEFLEFETYTSKSNSGREPRKKKKRRKKHYFLRFLLIIAVGVGLYYLANSSLFDIRDIEVEGNSYYTATQVEAISGIQRGTNIFFEFDKSETEDTLRQDPYIKTAEVKRSLPGTVNLKVGERTEAAAIPFGEKYALIDGEGMVLRMVEEEPKLPVLVGMTIRIIDPGYPLDVEEKSLLISALEMLESVEANDIYFKKIEISTVLIRAYIYDNLVCSGTPENIGTAIASGDLKTVLYDLYEKGTERGTVNVGANGYISFSPEI